MNPEHPAHNYFVERYQRILQLLEEGISEEQEQGILPAVRPAASLARALLAAMDGLQLQWLLEPTLSMTEAFDDALRTLNLA